MLPNCIRQGSTLNLYNIFVSHFHQTAEATDRQPKDSFPAVFFIFMPMGEPVICLEAINLEELTEAKAQHDDIGF